MPMSLTSRVRRLATASEELRTRKQRHRPYPISACAAPTRSPDLFQTTIYVPKVRTRLVVTKTLCCGDQLKAIVPGAGNWIFYMSSEQRRRVDQYHAMKVMKLVMRQASHSQVRDFQTPLCLALVHALEWSSPRTAEFVVNQSKTAITISAADAVRRLLQLLLRR